MYINATGLGFYDTYCISLFIMQKVNHQCKISKKTLWQVDVDSYFSHFILVVRLHEYVHYLRGTYFQHKIFLIYNYFGAIKRATSHVHV